jgi:hypothetical protein
MFSSHEKKEKRETMRKRERERERERERKRRQFCWKSFIDILKRKQARHK